MTTHPDLRVEAVAEQLYKYAVTDGSTTETAPFDMQHAPYRDQWYDRAITVLYAADLAEEQIRTGRDPRDD